MPTNRQTPAAPSAAASLVSLGRLAQLTGQQKAEILNARLAGKPLPTQFVEIEDGAVSIVLDRETAARFVSQATGSYAAELQRSARTTTEARAIANADLARRCNGKLMGSSEFRSMPAQHQSAFCLAGGQLTDDPSKAAISAADIVPRALTIAEFNALTPANRAAHLAAGGALLN